MFIGMMTIFVFVDFGTIMWKVHIFKCPSFNYLELSPQGEAEGAWKTVTINQRKARRGLYCEGLGWSAGG